LYGKREHCGKEVPKMSLHSFTHVALRVDRLRAAEAYYCTLFGLEVAWREADTPDGWATLPDEASWDDAERAGIHLGLVMLHRDGLRLALEAVDAVVQDGRLSHLGVFVDEQELERLRDTAATAGCTIVVDREQAFIIDDSFGVRWEFNTFPYADPPSMSTGARLGRWLDIGEPSPSQLPDPSQQHLPLSPQS
jgi:catechol 2,3-dioxygenase-like lactoylglutathione lyase family enzyme